MSGNTNESRRRFLKIASREDIHRHIDRMRERQSKVRALVKAEKSIEEVLRAFPENETHLITSIYTEISTGTETAK